MKTTDIAKALEISHGVFFENDFDHYKNYWRKEIKLAELIYTQAQQDMMEDVANAPLVAKDFEEWWRKRAAQDLGESIAAKVHCDPKTKEAFTAGRLSGLKERESLQEQNKAQAEENKTISEINRGLANRNHDLTLQIQTIEGQNKAQAEEIERLKSDREELVECAKFYAYRLKYGGGTAKQTLKSIGEITTN